MINGVITRKLNLLDENIRKLESLGKVTTAQLNENWQMKFAIERNLQITIEIVIDICQRIISLAGDAPVAKSTESIERCVEIGALSKNEPYLFAKINLKELGLSPLLLESMKMI